ncbi:MAG: hypothetical protein ACFFEV_08235 [Candidatus Thorarchaeota archaeon]
MTEAPVITKSALPYQISIFVLIHIWAFICFEVAQYQMVLFFESPLSWIGWSSLVIATMLPVLGLAAWKLKDRVQLQKPEWEFRIREVHLHEFNEMIKNYNKSYRHLISSVDYILIILLSVCYLALVTLPFYLMTTYVVVISLTPAILALITVVLGFLFSFFVFKFVPNSATSEFPTYQPRKFRKPISFLVGIPGIFWAGIQLTIGEAGGYYTIRSPVPIARIEGIEGAARIICEIDSSGNITQIIPGFESEEITPSEQLGIGTKPITPVTTAKLIRSMINEYVSNRGGEEILADVLDDIDIFLNKHDTITDPT